MRIAVRRLLGLGAAITALLLGATQASAEIVSCPSCMSDPPTVLISNPETSSAATLYATEPDHRVLREALERDESAPDLRPDSPGPASISVTWLTRNARTSAMGVNSVAHDVAISHIDFVRLGSDGQLWVQTVTPTDGGRGVSWKDGEWHAAADPAAARDVLEGAGVLSTGSSPKTDKADVEDQSAAPLTGWWWLLPGAGVGIVLGLGARPLAAEFARRREPGPRHQLIG